MGAGDQSALRDGLPDLFLPAKGPDYIGVTKISEYGVQLSFAVFCAGMDVYPLTNALNRELKLVCERRGILIAHHMYTSQIADA